MDDDRLLARTHRERRFWRYRYGAWSPRWWQWVLPMRGGDEFGRNTLVVHVPPLGFIAWAYRICRCADCAEARREIYAEGGFYWTEAAGMPGCFASGRDAAELAEALDEAKAMYRADA